MKLFLSICVFLTTLNGLYSQTNPAIISWLQNTTGIKGRHYVKGNPTPINDNTLANVQTVQYSNTSVYITTQGIPAYITGPFLDGNPSLATGQNAIFKLPLNPVKNSGAATATTPGNIGLFINGVALFDYRDGVSWHNASQTIKGGPGGGKGDGIWNRDAIVAERGGFDCAKGHPAMGNYHHHQNPSAFNLDIKVISTVCDIYVADGLYILDSTKHSPLIGFAYDGFPIYGAYGYKNADGTGGIVRMKSSFKLRSITQRTEYANGSDVTDGPVISSTYPLGYFREDYEYVPTSASTPEYLDEHNGRFCITPEYPEGIYCYFATVDEKWNSSYPYVVGPTFYGVVSAQKVTSITETVTTYTKQSPLLAVSTNNLTIAPPANSTKNFDISSNVSWTLSSDQTWLKADEQAGTGNKTIVLKADENTALTERSATITISGKDVPTQKITVTQQGTAPALSLSTNTLSISAEQNSTKTFDITSNTDWEVSADQTWLSVNSDKGSGDKTITITALENTQVQIRKASITISAKNLASKTITVTQSAAGILLSVSLSEIMLSSKASSDKVFEINSNTDWEININENWLSTDKKSGSGSMTIKIDAQENPSNSIRKANIVVSAQGTAPLTITVSQEANNPSGIDEGAQGIINIAVFPNPSSDLVILQILDINRENITIELFDTQGNLMQETTMYQGSTISYLDTRLLYSGEYLIRIKSSQNTMYKKFILVK